MNSKKVNNGTRNSLGKQIKEAREKLGFTQSQVAQKADMTVNYYAMIERGEVNPSLEKIKGIANVLKLKLTIS
ncbi:MAG: helix-turn-helix transcriptional regulator [Anaerolineae bacterium]|nr:helix-turn-helix transcriptional regulator [Anaerolineae bacterium]